MDINSVKGTNSNFKPGVMTVSKLLSMKSLTL